MELSHLGKRVGVTHRPSIEKAKEYQRLLGLKMPTTGPLGMVSARRQADRLGWARVRTEAACTVLSETPTEWSGTTHPLIRRLLVRCCLSF
jgi:hypothetical protein